METRRAPIRPEIGRRPKGAPQAPAKGAGGIRPRRRRLVLVSLLAAGGGLVLHSALQPAPPPAVGEATLPTVTVSAPLRRRMASWTDFLGQFSAIDRVEIRAQVSGYLTEIRFKDGQFVKKGDLLFVIDPRPYEIQLQQANAQYQTALAQIEFAKKQLGRWISPGRTSGPPDKRRRGRRRSFRVERRPLHVPFGLDFVPQPPTAALV